MAKPMRRYLLVIAIALLGMTGAIAGTTGAYAQSGCNDRGGQTSCQNNSVGGDATTGTGVKTGHGPLTQPVPPAVSTTNPQQNPQRPQNTQGPVQTNPPAKPFGSR